VFLVKDEKTEKFYAEKTILYQNTEELNQALLEAQAVLQLQHNSIVACHLFFTEQIKDENYVNIIYEFCESGSLQKVIQLHRSKKKIIPKSDILRWIEQITLGVMYCHEKEVIHRDLKQMFF
jgi:serine/threonine protein kinase